MGDFLKQELGVAMSGVKWDIGNFKLWQSTQPDIVLFTPKQPTLAKGANGRYQMACSQFRQQADDTYKITGGSAVFTVSSAVQYDAGGMERLKEQWRNEMAAAGPPPPKNPRFIPLNTQKGTAQVLINPMSGTPDPAHNDRNIGTPGGTNSFLVELTALGAQEWAQGIREKTAVPAGVKLMYEYLRMLPSVGAEVRIHAEKIFTHFSTSLSVSGGFFCGSSAQIDAAWERMKRSGDVEVNFIGAGLDQALEKIRTELVNTFINQVQQQVFNSMFEPKPDVKDAQASGGGGLFGGASFAAKFKRVEDVTDVHQTVKFEGWTWLQASMDADMTTLFSELDQSYVTEVNTEMSFPATVVVDADPQVETTAVSWSASEGKSPETPVMGTEGGVERYTVTSAKPEDVMIDWKAKVNFAPASWPVIETSGSAKVRDGGGQVVVKPGSWLGRHKVYLFVKDANGDVALDPASAVLANTKIVVNVGYTGPHLSRAISESAELTPSSCLEFSYPLDPKHAAGTATFSAFGVIGGQMVRAKEQVINLDESAVFVLASPKGIQLVSQNSVFGESDGLASALLTAKAKPQFADLSGSTSEARRQRHRETDRTAPILTSSGSNRSVQGLVVGVDYTGDGTAALLVEHGGETEVVKLRSLELADVFDDVRKHVWVTLDDEHYARSIHVSVGT